MNVSFSKQQGQFTYDELFNDCFNQNLDECIEDIYANGGEVDSWRDKLEDYELDSKVELMLSEI